jgi:hypothetical protein
MDGLIFTGMPRIEGWPIASYITKFSFWFLDRN